MVDDRGTVAALRSDGGCSLVYQESVGAQLLNERHCLIEEIVRFRQGCVQRGSVQAPWGIGSPADGFRKQGIHIVADAIAETVADDTYFVEPDDQRLTVAGG